MTGRRSQTLLRAPTDVVLRPRLLLVAAPRRGLGGVQGCAPLPRECKPRDEVENSRLISGQRAEADWDATRERDVCGVRLVPETISSADKLLPPFHLS